MKRNLQLAIATMIFATTILRSVVDIIDAINYYRESNPKKLSNHS